MTKSPQPDAESAPLATAPAQRRQIDATALTTFDIDPSGTYARLHVRDRSGQPATLKLPTDCLNQLLMTLPSMVQTALRNSHGDDSLRLVHSLDHFSLELGQPDADGRQQFILTLQTGNGFGVSFAVRREALNEIANTLATDLPEAATPQALARRLS